VAGDLSRAAQLTPFGEARRPVYFGLATAFGLALSAFGVVGSIAFLSVDQNFWFPVRMQGALLFGLCISLVRFAVLLDLRDGRRRAWVAIQVMAAMEILLSIVGIIRFGRLGVVSTVIPVVLYACLLPILYTAKVQEFCADGV